MSAGDDANLPVAEPEPLLQNGAEGFEVIQNKQVIEDEAEGI